MSHNAPKPPGLDPKQLMRVTKRQLVDQMIGSYNSMIALDQERCTQLAAYRDEAERLRFEVGLLRMVMDVTVETVKDHGDDLPYRCPCSVCRALTELERGLDKYDAREAEQRAVLEKEP